MKKLVVISDNHGEYYTMNDIKMKEFDTDIFIHLGDSCLPNYLLDGFLCVKGNMDFSCEAPLIRDIEIEGFKIHLEHGNSFKFITNKKSYINKIGADIFLYGHTHSKDATKIDNIYLFNPGSLTRPRDSSKGSYLILYLEKDKPLKYEFKEV